MTLIATVPRIKNTEWHPRSLSTILLPPWHLWSRSCSACSFPFQPQLFLGLYVHTSQNDAAHAWQCSDSEAKENYHSLNHHKKLEDSRTSAFVCSCVNMVECSSACVRACVRACVQVCVRMWRDVRVYVQKLDGRRSVSAPLLFSKHSHHHHRHPHQRCRFGSAPRPVTPEENRQRFTPKRPGIIISTID
jgi:hypothetical protein